MNCGVPAVDRPDRPRYAGIRGVGRCDVVGTLPERPPDGMDGRQVEHVESQACHVWQPGDHVLQRAVAASRLGGRAREELIPRRELRELWIDGDLELPMIERIQRKG